MVPHLWHAGLVHGLSVSILVWSQKGEVPDAIVWQATNEARDAIFLADDPQMAYMKAEYHEASPERLARRVVLAALGELMNVAQSITMTMDRLTVEQTHTTTHHAIPRTASLADLFHEADEEIEHAQRIRRVENMPTMAWSDIPTISVNRITGDDVKPQRGAGGCPPPPPPEEHGGWRRS